MLLEPKPKVLIEAHKEDYSKWKKNKLNEKSGFFIIFNDFVKQGHLRYLSGGAAKLYIYLACYSHNDTGESWHSIESISEYFQCGERTAKRWFSELEMHDLIFRVQIGYKWKSNTVLKGYD